MMPILRRPKLPTPASTRAWVTPSRGAVQAARRAWTLLFLVTFVVAAAPAACAETIAEALAAAYNSNPRLDADRARQRAQDEEVARANAGYRPRVEASAEAGYQRTDNHPLTEDDGETHPKSYTIRGTQPIFRGFRTLNQVRQAEAQVRAGRETLRVTEQAVLLEAATAYLNVIRSMSTLRSRESLVSALSSELRATRVRLAAGEVTRTDFDQVEARRSDAVALAELARFELARDRANYERVVGHAPGRLVKPRVPASLLPRSLDEAIAITLAEQASVVGALYAEQAARHNVDLIRGELLPSASLEGAYTRRVHPTVPLRLNEVSTVTGRVNVPLYSDGGEVYARVRQAKESHVQRLQEVELQRTLAREATYAAWALLRTAKARREASRQTVRSAETALAGVRKEERVGQRSILEILNSERELTQARIDLATSERDDALAAFTLLQAMGRLNVARLGVVGEVYDPEEHYWEVRRRWFGLSITRPDGRVEAIEVPDLLGPQPTGPGIDPDRP